MLGAALFLFAISICVAQCLVYLPSGLGETKLGYNHRRINHYNA